MTGTVPAPAPPATDGNPAARRRGTVIAVIGLAGFIPALLAAVFLADWRFPAALVMLAFWVVWKIGRTIVKVSSGDS
ncbi:MAG: hypothetical protein KF858_06125 [Candidatus Sumerlaeia bacterium]|nr:hypothetical protein [Candidatus Sumerlaeia bacterium]